MSGTSTPAGKTMSSRLLTMKFMQRAAHSPSTTPSAPSTPDEPSAKRRKVSSPSNQKFNVDDLADRNAVQAALAIEEAKREAALERQAAAAGDTRWVLTFGEEEKSIESKPLKVLRVVETGWAGLDAPVSSRSGEGENEDGDRPVMVGRRSFGRFNRVIEKQRDPTIESESESEPSADDDDDDEDDEDQDSSSGSESEDPTTTLIKDERKHALLLAKQARLAKKSEANQVAKKRRKENPAVNLNKLTSLSGTRQDRGKPQPPAGMKCFNCGGNHFKRDCPTPNAGKRGHEGDDGDGPRKVRKQK